MGSVSFNDRWHWRVQYQDGSTIDEDDNGRLRGWAEVRATDVWTLQLTPQQEDMRHFLIYVPAGGEAFFYRRRSFVQSFDGEVLSQKTVSVLGFREGDGSVYQWDVDDDGNITSSEPKPIERSGG